MIYRGVRTDKDDKRKIHRDRLKVLLIAIAVIAVVAAAVFGMRMPGIR